MIVFCRVSSSSHLVTKCKDGWRESLSSEAKTSGAPLLAAHKPLSVYYFTLFWSAVFILGGVLQHFLSHVCWWHPALHYSVTTWLQLLSECVQHISEWMGQKVLQPTAQNLTQAKNYRPNQKPVWNLSTLDTQQLVHSLLCSRLEYCHGVFTDLCKNQ